MFKIGDVVVCTDSHIGVSVYLELDKIYVVHNTFDNFISLESVDNTILFNQNMFIPLPKYRKLKLEKICLKLEM